MTDSVVRYVACCLCISYDKERPTNLRGPFFASTFTCFDLNQETRELFVGGGGCFFSWGEGGLRTWGMMMGYILGQGLLCLTSSI